MGYSKEKYNKRKSKSIEKQYQINNINRKLLSKVKS